MAKVKVHMYATLREAAGATQTEIDADDVASMLEVLGSRCGPRLVKIFEAAKKDHDLLVILINGRNLDREALWNTKLRDGDEVAIFPPVSGG